MVDTDLQPFVLEVNLVPSLAKQVASVLATKCMAEALAHADVKPLSVL